MCEQFIRPSQRQTHKTRCSKSDASINCTVSFGWRVHQTRKRGAAALRVSSGLQTSAADFASTGIDVALALRLTAQLPKDCIICIRDRCLRCSFCFKSSISHFWSSYIPNSICSVWPWIFLGIPRCCGLDRELDLETDPPAKVDGEKLEGSGFGGSRCRDLVAKVVKRGNPLKMLLKYCLKLRVWYFHVVQQTMLWFCFTWIVFFHWCHRDIPPTQQLRRFSMCHVAMVGLDVISYHDVTEKSCSEWDPEALNMGDILALRDVRYWDQRLENSHCSYRIWGNTKLQFSGTSSSFCSMFWETSQQHEQWRNKKCQPWLYLIEL